MKKLVIPMALSLLSLPAFSQAWMKGGNNPSANPFTLGSNTNDPIMFETNNTQRMIIDNGGTGNAAGRAIFSNDATGITPATRLHLHQTAGAVSMVFNNTVGTANTDGLTIGISAAGDAFFINNELNQNFNWYNQGGGGPGTLLGRMRLYDGGVGQATGRLALGNDLPGGFVAVDRQVLYENATTGAVRTRYQNTTTGVSATDGYAIGVSNLTAIPNDRVVNHTQYENRPMRWLSPQATAGGAITEWMRIQNGATGSMNASSSSDGYIGLNNSAPTFHIDGITPAINSAQELFLSFATSDAAGSRIGLCNGGVTNNRLSPTFFGNVGTGNTGYALQTLSAIDGTMDISIVNGPAVTQFRSGKNWVPNSGSGIDDLDEIVNRYAFSWMNGNTVKMFMNARGQVRIADALGTTATPPNNRLEITADATYDPYGSAIATNGASGLCLTHLTSAKTPVINPGAGVLAVDNVGNVIYVPSNGGGGTGFGNVCGAALQNPLTSDWEIPLGTTTTGYNYLFSGQGTANYNVGIGLLNCTPVAKLDVLQRSTNLGSIGINVVNRDDQSIGVKSFVGVNNNRELCVAGDFTARSQKLNKAVNALADPFVSISGSSTVNYAGYFESKNGDTGYGGYFIASGSTINNYGIYAEAPIGSVPTSSAVAPGMNYAGYFNGDVVRTGTDNFTSDQNLKQHIDTIPNAMGIINQLQPKTFEYKQSSYPSMSLPGGKQYGLIAQDVQAILPELVNQNVHPAKLDSAGNVITPAVNYLSLEYQQLMGIMIRAMQQQQAQINKQDSLITVLNHQINYCCSNNNARTNNSLTQQGNNQLDVELSDKDAIVLNQNVPNPFAEQTTITYHVPQSVGKAQLLFYNSNGQLIQSVEIKTRGKGKVNVFASDLSGGLYHYTLVADGKVVDSKKMVRE